MNKEWLDNMKKVRDRWESVYLDMLHWGDNYMPLEMGFIFWSLGKPDHSIPYSNRGYYFDLDGKIWERV